ncbi:hypothetical protein BH11BAC7_BH11BAC7_28810 [soil metagenome]
MHSKGKFTVDYQVIGKGKEPIIKVKKTFK